MKIYIIEGNYNLTKFIANSFMNLGYSPYIICESQESYRKYHNLNFNKIYLIRNIEEVPNTNKSLIVNLSTAYTYPLSCKSILKKLKKSICIIKKHSNLKFINFLPSIDLSKNSVFMIKYKNLHSQLDDLPNNNNIYTSLIITKGDNILTELLFLLNKFKRILY